ncbi:tail fiber protein [Arenibaculum sp.]|jgi:hypothetical protein|uniref:tail fiber protein n=1 Tax=Arenibaculum sp. TaxID=2865862 RepID=UPI002E15C4DB|nr:tail fiber protein [Arenibaculum sp.]
MTRSAIQLARVGLAAGALFLTAGAAQACGPNPVMGSVCFFAFPFCPQGYEPVLGQQVEISDDVPYSRAMFSLVQDYYGQPPRTTLS